MDLVLDLLRKYRLIARNVIHFGYVGTITTVSASILKRQVTRSTVSTVKITDRIYYRAYTPIEQEFAKKLAIVFLEHEEIVNDIEEILEKMGAKLILDHQQVIVAQEEKIPKVVSVIELGHEQIKTYIEQSLNKEIAGIEIHAGYYYG